MRGASGEFPGKKRENKFIFMKLILIYYFTTKFIEYGWRDMELVLLYMPYVKCFFLKFTMHLFLPQKSTYCAIPLVFV